MFFKDEYAKERDKEFDVIEFRSKRRNVKYRPHQIGKTNVSIDEARKALLVGKRISKNGNIYYEYRKNRGDLKGSTI